MAIANTVPEHSGEEPRTTWEFDEEDNTIFLTIATSYEENTSCNCHPEYETREHISYHSIPASQLLTDIDSLDSEYDFTCTEFFKELQTKIKAAEEAERQKRIDERLRREREAQADLVRREQAEFARLQSKYGN